MEYGKPYEQSRVHRILSIWFTKVEKRGGAYIYTQPQTENSRTHMGLKERTLTITRHGDGRVRLWEISLFDSGLDEDNALLGLAMMNSARIARKRKQFDTADFLEYMLASFVFLD